MSNLFENIPSELPEELVEILASKGTVRIERIVSRGQASPEGFWYDEPTDEFVVLLSGGASLEFEADGEVVELKAGDYRLIGAHERHRVVATDLKVDSVWLAVHF